MCALRFAKLLMIFFILYIKYLLHLDTRAEVYVKVNFAGNGYCSSQVTEPKVTCVIVSMK